MKPGYDTSPSPSPQVPSATDHLLRHRLGRLSRSSGFNHISLRTYYAMHEVKCSHQQNLQESDCVTSTLDHFLHSDRSIVQTALTKATSLPDHTGCSPKTSPLLPIIPVTPPPVSDFLLLGISQLWGSCCLQFLAVESQGQTFCLQVETFSSRYKILEGGMGD